MLSFYFRGTDANFARDVPIKGSVSFVISRTYPLKQHRPLKY